ncbi:MAG: hypothetical protein ABFD10_16240 [Prolixibacteraceae bacterium]
MNDLFDFDDEEEFQTYDEPPLVFFPKRTRKKKKDRLYPQMIQLFEMAKEPDILELPDEMYFCFFEDIVLN